MDVIFLKSLRPLYCDYISRILCVRRAQQRRPPRPPFMYFYSRPYARGNCGSRFVSAPVTYFYSRPYERGDTLSEPAYLTERISTPAPTRGTTGIFSNCVCPMIFLLAPLREGRPGGEAHRRLPSQISTRAPTRGATAIFHKTTS